MAFVVVPTCTKCQNCITACNSFAIAPAPTDPDWGTVSQVYINPAACQNLLDCVFACPSTAIYPEEDVPPEYYSSIAANAAYFASNSLKNKPAA